MSGASSGGLGDDTNQHIAVLLYAQCSYSGFSQLIREAGLSLVFVCASNLRRETVPTDKQFVQLFAPYP